MVKQQCLKNSIAILILTHIYYGNMGYKPKGGGNIMNKYESVVIVNPNLEEESVKSLINKFSDLINTDGKVDSVEELGKKKLAYEIKKQKEAYYLIFKFEANPELISELERNYRITDEVIKFIVVKEEE